MNNRLPKPPYIVRQKNLADKVQSESVDLLHFIDVQLLPRLADSELDQLSAAILTEKRVRHPDLRLDK